MPKAIKVRRAAKLSCVSGALPQRGAEGARARGGRARANTPQHTRLRPPAAHALARRRLRLPNPKTCALG